MCTMMKTGWPISNHSGRGRWDSRAKPTEASKTQSHKQNPSVLQVFRAPELSRSMAIALLHPLVLQMCNSMHWPIPVIIQLTPAKLDASYIFGRKRVAAHGQPAAKPAALHRALWPPDRGELLQLTQAALLDMGQLSSQDSMFWSVKLLTLSVTVRLSWQDLLWCDVLLNLGRAFHLYSTGLAAAL